MNGFAKAMIARKHQEKSETRTKAPKGFDILLADVMLQFDFSQDDIVKLGQMTARGQIAHATVGSRVYYRRETIERLFGGN